jgi:hypothetical protein
MILPRHLELPIDIGGLIVALVVDIVMNVICFATLAPDMITRVAFVAIGIMIVLFVPRSWSKRQFVAWAVFASVVFFFDYSFMLVATKAQTEHKTVNVFIDDEVIRLDNEKKLHDANILDLQRQYSEAARRETMDQINENIEAERALAIKADESRSARIQFLTKQVELSSGITSAEIFTAIPDAAKDGRIIQLIVFGLIFVGLQLIIGTSIDNKTKNLVSCDADKTETGPTIEDISKMVESGNSVAVQQEEPDVTVTSQDVDRFVRLTWYRVEQHTNAHILPKESCIAYFKKIGDPIDDAVYDKISVSAHEAGLINDDDIVRVTDASLATKRLKELLCDK